MNPAKIAEEWDKTYLQNVGDGKIGFSRLIGTADKDAIMYYGRFGGRKPPRIDHQGIEDHYSGKASQIHDHYRGKWIVLTGMD